MTDTCIFCNAEANATMASSEDGFVLIDDPVRPGHVLVGARKHVENLHELESHDAEALLRLASRVAREIVALTGAAKVYVTGIGDKDKHFHFHLLPKMAGDRNLGPYIFGEMGWASFLPAPPNATDLSLVNERIMTIVKVPGAR